MIFFGFILLYRNKYAKWKATSLLCGPADLDLEDIGATLLPMGYVDTSTTKTPVADDVALQQFLELQQQQKAEQRKLQQYQKQQQQQKGRISSFSESAQPGVEAPWNDNGEEEDAMDDRFAVSSPNLTQGGQHFIDSLTSGAKKTQSPKSPKSVSSARDETAANDGERSSSSPLAALEEIDKVSSGEFESGSYNTKSGRVSLKSPPTTRKGQMHPTAIVAPIVNESESGRQQARSDGKTTPQHQQRRRPDDVAESDDASSSMQRLAINDDSRTSNSGSRNNNPSSNSSRNASWIDSAMPNMASRTEQQQRQQQHLFQSRAAVTLRSKNSKQTKHHPSQYGEDEEDEEEERELEEMRKEEERKKDWEFLVQIRRDLTTEFVGEDGKTRKDAETQTLSTGRILVTEMFMNDGI